MVINHLLTGMILQVDSHDDWFDGQTTCFGRGVKVWRFLKVGVLLGGGFIFFIFTSPWGNGIQFDWRIFFSWVETVETTN